MNTDQLLRDAAPDADALHSHARRLRDQVIAGFDDGRPTAAAQTRSNHRRTSLIVSGALAAVVGLGGVAYATGTLPLPRMFSDSIDAASFVKDKPAMSQVVDLALPDGGRFAVWRGQSKTSFCEASTDYSDRNQAEKGYSGELFCTDTLDGPAAEANQIVLNWAAGKERVNGEPSTWYPVIYGGTTLPEATRVQISGTYVETGRPVDMSIGIDPTTHVFAAVLPGTTRHPWGLGKNADPHVLGKLPPDSGLTLTFTDDHGTILATHPVTFH